MVGELPDGAEVGLLGALAEAGQLKVLVHPLAKRSGHEWLLSKRGKKDRLETTLPAMPASNQPPTGSKRSRATVDRLGIAAELMEDAPPRQRLT